MVSITLLENRHNTEHFFTLFNSCSVTYWWNTYLHYIISIMFLNYSERAFLGLLNYEGGTKRQLPISSPKNLSYISYNDETWTDLVIRLKKYINHVTHSLSSANISIFLPNSATFVISRNKDVDCLLKHNF